MEDFMLLRRFESIEKTDNGYLVKGDSAFAKIIFLTDDIIRIRVSFDGKFRESSYALVTTAWDDDLDELLKDERKRINALDVPCEDKGNEIVFSTSSLTLVLNKAPFHFRLYDSSGDLIYSDLPERAFDKDQLGRLSHYSRVDREKDHFYGFGEKTGHLDKKGRHMRMSPKDAIGHDPETGDPMYKHIPFYIRINEDQQKALGLFYNNSYDAVFDMCSEISGYWERYSFYQTDGGDIDLFLINGPSMKSVIDRYTFLTGRPAMPTKQAIGFTDSTMYYAELDKDCDKEIYKVIEKHFKENIYIDNFWLASGYSSGEKDNLRYVFNWNKKRFPDPKAFFDKMNEMGINVIPNLKPGILKHHPYIKDFEKADAFIKAPDGKSDYYGRWWGGTGRFVDFTSPSGRNCWKELLKKNILEMGTKTVWNDNCEMDGVEDREARCSKEGMGSDMAELKIIHSNMMAYLAKEAIAEVYPNERPYIINRAGYAGIQRYAQVWGGDNLTDWRTVKFNIATIMGMGLSGCPDMGCDIGGFAGPAPGPELLVRWIQNGIFQPRFCMNSANNDNTVTQPWMYEEMLPYVKAAFAQRYRMIPYLYSQMYQAYLTGVPAMRPLFLEFPEDRNCYNDKLLTFMFGPALLVANVVEEGAETRRIYLPAGTCWYDMNDNMRRYEGGQTIEIPVDISSIPMFLRGGSVYFTSEDIHHASTDRIHTLDFIISADSDTSAVFYDDDGHTKDFEKGVFARTGITVKAGERKVISFHREGSFIPEIEKLTMKVVSPDKGAYWVSVNDRRLPQYIIREAYDEADEGWFYNLSERTIMLKTAMPEECDFTIVVSTEKFDLIGMAEDE